MARTRSTSGDPGNPAAAETEVMEATPEAPINSGVITGEPCDAAAERPAAEPPIATTKAPVLPDLLAAIPSPLAIKPAAPERPGLVTITKGEQLRQVHPVDVAEWLELGLGWEQAARSPLASSGRD